MTVEEQIELLRRFPQGAQVEGPPLTVVTDHSYGGVCHWPVGMPDADVPDWSRPDKKASGGKPVARRGEVLITLDCRHDAHAEVMYTSAAKHPGWSVDQDEGQVFVVGPGQEVHDWLLRETEDFLPGDFPELAPYCPSGHYWCRHCGTVDGLTPTGRDLRCCGAPMERRAGA